MDWLPRLKGGSHVQRASPFFCMRWHYLLLEFFYYHIFYFKKHLFDIFHYYYFLIHLYFFIFYFFVSELNTYLRTENGGNKIGSTNIFFYISSVDCIAISKNIINWIIFIKKSFLQYSQTHLLCCVVRKLLQHLKYQQQNRAKYVSAHKGVSTRPLSVPFLFHTSGFSQWSWLD